MSLSSFLNQRDKKVEVDVALRGIVAARIMSRQEEDEDEEAAELHLTVDQALNGLVCQLHGAHEARAHEMRRPAAGRCYRLRAL